MDADIASSNAEKSTPKSGEVQSMAPTPRGDLFARTIGFLVFVLGLSIIIAVLMMGFDLYRDPNLGIRSTGPTPTATEIGSSLARIVLKLLLLFLGSISGSLIANKGVKLYFASLGGTIDKS